MGELRDKGIISDFRYEQLTKDIFNHTIIIHEAGIPPIHTPLSVLNDLPCEIKKKLYCVHVSDLDIAKFPDLKKNPCGVENTIILKQNYIDTENDIIEMLEKIPAFSSCTFSCLKDLV